MVVFRKEAKQAIDQITEAAKSDGTPNGRDMALSRASAIFADLMDKANQPDLAAINRNISRFAAEHNKEETDRWIQKFEKQSKNKVLMPFLPAIRTAFKAAGKVVGKDAAREIKNLEDSLKKC